MQPSMPTDDKRTEVMGQKPRYTQVQSRQPSMVRRTQSLSQSANAQACA